MRNVVTERRQFDHISSIVDQCRYWENRMALTVDIYRFFFFFQAEDGIRDLYVTGVQTCALPISTILKGLDDPELERRIGADALAELREELELVQGASHPFDIEKYLAGEQTPVFFGSGINNFGVQPLLDFFVEHAPSPQARAAATREVSPEEEKLSGFVFKIQANMDPAHRDRVAFLRMCSGQYTSGMKALQVRTGKEVKLANALTFMASEREIAETAYPGDVIGLHNHGTISIGDTFTEGEPVSFTGIPNFAPELFRRARLRHPLKMKALQKGLAQLSEEGAT